MARFVRHKPKYSTEVRIPAPPAEQIDCPDYRNLFRDSPRAACACPHLSKTHAFLTVWLNDLDSPRHFFKICPRLTPEQRKEFLTEAFKNSRSAKSRFYGPDWNPEE